MKKPDILEIDITDKGLKINSELFTFPIDLNKLSLIFGEPDFFKMKYNDIYTWHEIGVLGYSKKKKQIETLEIYLSNQKDLKFSPRKLFNQVLKINGESYQEIKFKKNKKSDFVEKQIGNNSLYMEFNEKDSQYSTISITDFKEPPILQDPDRYDYKPVAGEKMEFADFNFKLAIIQILMYEKELLRPKFDLYEFVERYKDREIDVDEEGYALIPEVTAYFEKLEIDKKFASEITEIYQDGGDDIYLNMLCFWDGEDDVFNINTITDVEQFSNLKTLSLFSDTQFKEREYLKSKGIGVENIYIR
ncbi:DUF6892 domain-containing protein [Flavobacterium sp.]|uniref:DUF6892 domain-containing protein n=1 Tax=Flavobacterium sp. TaxID=239 RepID=UPI00374DA8BE